MAEITLESKVGVPKGVTFCEMDDEIALLHEGSGEYFGLDEIGSHLFDIFGKTQNLGEAHMLLREEYDPEDVTNQDLTEAILGFVEELVELQLLEVK